MPLVTRRTVIVTPTGEYPPTPEMLEVLGNAKLRLIDRQPDRRTKAGKRWGALYHAFATEKLKEYTS